MSSIRLSHGEALPLEATVESAVEGSPKNKVIEPNAAADESQSFPFGYLFPDLQSDEYLLPENKKTVAGLRDLGAKMQDPGTTPGAPVPTIYTFFGQFVDHDITLEKASDRIRDVSAPNPTPISPDEINKQIVNSRSPNLELDSMYTPDAPWDPADRNKMLLGTVSLPTTLPPGKDPKNDLPRRPKSSDPKFDRLALIGDARNDENLILAQLHVAFLRAHNALVDGGCDFDEAKKLLIQHYQWIVLDDFLDRIADPAIVRKVRYEGPTFFTPSEESFYMPLEFSVAAYRFGHSKVRPFYRHFNSVQPPTAASLTQLFAITRFSGQLATYDNIPGNWVIDWTNFVSSDDPDSFPRPIDTLIARPLLRLRGFGATILGEENLAVRNLIRGYILRIPTGQAVARAMQARVPSIIPLTEKDIASVLTAEQLQVLGTSGLLDRIPLWFYVLAEAMHYSRGSHLGPAGSTIVAEVLIGVLRNSDYSILLEPGWRPTLPSRVPGEFDVSDLLRLAGVL